MKSALSNIAIAAMLLAPTLSHAATTEFPARRESKGATLRIASVTDLPVFRPMIDAFQSRYPDIAISYEESTSDTLDVVLEKACLEEKDFADLVISSSLPRQIWFVNEGCAEPIDEVAQGGLPNWAQWRNEINGLTYEPAVIVYNKAAIPPDKVPRNRFDLIDLLRSSNTYNGKVGTYDIERSGVGYFFAFEDSEQASTWGRLLESFGRNRVKLFCCTGEILDRVADGRLLFGYNVLGSYALERMRKDNRLGIIMPSDYTLVMSRTAFIPKTAKAKAAAKLFIDFVLSREGQSILEDKMNFTSSLRGAEGLKDQLTGGIDSLRPIALTPALLVPLDQEKKRTFIEQWRQSVNPDRGP
ncbi:ABC transporter substrate-binding protein [Rhizobium sp. L1K21]|uniref:ABC transporter substrate-binding protein n=1 Tax=Rhizobium sp. L1K21 TaxID=2954933 RepID=UPI002092C550|nr:ABC transporter substrate-binding protein [Rhizobium sp. L1K21]MCO6185233.1 ABC transporter substrate-binding protein [Rhizobium sp. L1K21]